MQSQVWCWMHEFQQEQREKWRLSKIDRNRSVNLAKIFFLLLLFLLVTVENGAASTATLAKEKEKPNGWFFQITQAFRWMKHLRIIHCIWDIAGYTYAAS